MSIGYSKINKLEGTIHSRVWRVYFFLKTSRVELACLTNMDQVIG
jgi:hypothetical protein